MSEFASAYPNSRKVLIDVRLDEKEQLAGAFAPLHDAF